MSLGREHTKKDSKKIIILTLIRAIYEPMIMLYNKK